MRKALVEDRVKKLMNFIPKKDIVYSSDPYIEGLTEEEIAYFDKRFEEENDKLTEWPETFTGN